MIAGVHIGLWINILGLLTKLDKNQKQQAYPTFNMLEISSWTWDLFSSHVLLSFNYPINGVIQLRWQLLIHNYTATVINDRISLQLWWNGADSRNRSTRRKTCPSTILFTIDPALTGLGSKVGLRGENPTPRRPSQGTGTHYSPPKYINLRYFRKIY